MNTINFLSGGKMGDFIHSLYVVKNICEQRNSKANVYLDEGGDVWTFGIEKAYMDLYPIISKQPYINKFQLEKYWVRKQGGEVAIDLNGWRVNVAKTHAETGKYNKCWSELLSEIYNFEIPKEYQWLFVNEEDEFTKNKTVVHRSLRHHADNGFWYTKLLGVNRQLFVSTDYSEYNNFFLKDEVQPYILKSVSEWIIAIASCKYFLGNQSAGFAIASALDIPRNCELYPDVAVFYEGETKYSKNINLTV